MADVFPTRLFRFNESEVGIERQTLRGGVSLAGEEDVISADGGGRVFAEFSNGPLIDRSPTLAWRAFLARMEEGVVPVIVPFCDARHTPYVGAPHRVPHSDDTPFSDETLYVGGGAPNATLTSNAALRATTIAFAISDERLFQGGEWFSIEHPTKGYRAYQITSVNTQGNVSFRPPLREAAAIGTVVNFSAPRCLMVQDGRSRSQKQGRYTEAAIRFIEAP